MNGPNNFYEQAPPSHKKIIHFVSNYCTVLYIKIILYKQLKSRYGENTRIM